MSGVTDQAFHQLLLGRKIHLASSLRTVKEEAALVYTDNSHANTGKIVYIRNYSKKKKYSYIHPITYVAPERSPVGTHSTA